MQHRQPAAQSGGNSSGVVPALDQTREPAVPVPHVSGTHSMRSSSVKSKARGEKEQRGPGAFMRIARGLSFAHLASLVTKARERAAAARTPKAAAPAARPAPRKQAAAPAPAGSSASPSPRREAEDAAEAKGRMAERARCAGIVLSGPGQRNPALAVHLATQTDVSLKEALAVLEAAPAAGTHGNPDRAARNPRLVGFGEATPSQDAAARMDRALKQAAPRTAQAPGSAR